MSSTTVDVKAMRFPTTPYTSDRPKVVLAFGAKGKHWKSPLPGKKTIRKRPLPLKVLALLFYLQIYVYMTKKTKLTHRFFSIYGRIVKIFVVMVSFGTVISSWKSFKGVLL